MKELVCKNCGKTCPDVKYCIYCGALLEEPDKVFMDKKFDTAEECNTVKHDYALLTERFTSEGATYTVRELQDAILACKDGNYHPTAQTLALPLLKEKFSALQFTLEKNTRTKVIKAFVAFDVVLLILILLFKPIMNVSGADRTVLQLLPLLIPGKAGGAIWAWNAVVLFILAVALLCLLGAFLDKKINTLTAAPFIVPCAFILIGILNAVMGLLGLNYKCAEGSWWLICSGIIIGALDYIVLPQKYRN